MQARDPKLAEKNVCYPVPQPTNDANDYQFLSENAECFHCNLSTRAEFNLLVSFAIKLHNVSKHIGAPRYHFVLTYFVLL